MTSQTKLFVVLIIILGLAGGYLYYSQAIQPNAAQVPPSPLTDQKDTLRQFKTITIEFSNLSNDIFSTLSTFGESPVQPGLTGKKDLFAPF